MTLDSLDPLIQEIKLSPPQSSGLDVLERPRLLELLEKNRDKKLILLSASAGYGKSTLMSQWYQSLKQRGINVGWLTVDDDDNDVGRLFTYLRYSLEGIKVELSPAADFRSVIKNHAALLANLFHQDDSPSVLFIDELEVLSNAESLRLFSLLVQLMPSDCQLVIASRQTPDWSLSKLKLSGELLELSDQELKFSAEEANRLGELKLIGSHEAITEQLIEKTEGWIAGIRLAMLCLPRIENARTWIDNISGELDEITDFLTEEVFRHLGTEQQIFLLKISVLNRLSASLCEAITGESGAQTQLESFYEKGLFIQPMDEQRQWFRLHGLVRQFLLKRLKQLIPQKVSLLHSNAAQWYRQNGYRLESIHHAITAKEYKFATEILEEVSKSLISQGQLSTVSSLAAEISQHHPIESHKLLSSLCWADVFLHNLKSADSSITRLKELCQEQGEPTELHSELLTLEAMLLIVKDDAPQAAEVAEKNLSHLGEQAFFERGVLSNIIAFTKMFCSDFEVSRQYQLKARAAHLKSGSCFGLAYSDMIGAYQEKLQGNLYESLKRFAEIGHGPDYSLYVDSTTSYSIAKSVSYGFELELLYELNRLNEAERLLEHHFVDTSSSTVPDIMIATYLVRARLAFTQKQFELAYTILEEGELVGVNWPLPRTICALRWERVRFALLLGDIESAKRFAEKTQIDNTPTYPSFYIPLSEECSGATITPLRLDIHTGQGISALDNIDRLIPKPDTRPCQELTFMVLRVLAYISLGRNKDAQDALIAALDLGSKIGAVRSIVDEGPQVISLLKKLYIDWVSQPNLSNKKRIQYCETLLEAAGEPISLSSTQKAAIDELSERELEILKLVDDGLKNDQIAVKLFLSVNTVKWHLRRAYEKLGVRSRTEALAEIRKLGIID